MKAHKLAKILLALPDVEVTVSGAYGSTASIDDDTVVFEEEGWHDSRQPEVVIKTDICSG